MAKRKKGNYVGHAYRIQLENIGVYLGLADARRLSNQILIEAICTQRKIPLAPPIKNHARLVVEWFSARENEAVKSPRKPKKQNRSSPEPFVISLITVESKEEFYRSWEWRTLRMQVLKQHGARCQCCGAGRNDLASSGDPVRICVDHIKPLSKRWDLRLTPSNLQILCDECNMGKGAWDTTDWREAG